MGGLVARRFIALNAAGEGGDFDMLLATFSTPFGGVPIARLGLTLGAYAVPSWHDLAPDSVFLRSLRAQPLPERVRHYVFFGYREDGGDFDSDGVISVASQRAAKRGARARLQHRPLRHPRQPLGLQELRRRPRRFRLKPGRNRAATPPAEHGRHENPT